MLEFPVTFKYKQNREGQKKHSGLESLIFLLYGQTYLRPDWYSTFNSWTLTLEKVALSDIEEFSKIFSKRIVSSFKKLHIINYGKQLYNFN